MNVKIRLTDNAWFVFLKNKGYKEVNFWSPSGRNTNFENGELVLFKKHKNSKDEDADGLIVGGGFVKDFYIKPTEEVWNTLGDKNGCATKDDFYEIINEYRKRTGNLDNNDVGCLILENVFYLQEGIDAEKEIPHFTWSKSIVRGKTIKEEDVKEALLKAIKINLAR